MATIVRSGKRVNLTIQEKALLLQVIVKEKFSFAVRSGSDARKFYTVEHDGKHVTSCNCDHCKYHATPCAYKTAVELRLKQDRYDLYTSIFGTVDFYGI